MVGRVVYGILLVDKARDSNLSIWRFKNSSKTKAGYIGYHITTDSQTFKQLSSKLSLIKFGQRLLVKLVPVQPKQLMLVGNVNPTIPYLSVSFAVTDFPCIREIGDHLDIEMRQSEMTLFVECLLSMVGPSIEKSLTLEDHLITVWPASWG